MRALLVAVLVVVLVGDGRAQLVPRTRAVTLDKSVVTFPPSEYGKLLLLLISFSHKGERECDQWNQRLKPAYLHHAHVDYYELADFEGVPSFIMHMILHGLRRQVPRDEQAHFVLMYSNEAEWKKLVGYSRPEDAYVVVADSGGRVWWQGHGAGTDAQYSGLQAAIDKLVSKP